MRYVIFEKKLEMYFGGKLIGGATIWHSELANPRVQSYDSEAEAQAVAYKLGDDRDFEFRTYIPRAREADGVQPL